MNLLYVHNSEKVKTIDNKTYYTDGSYDKNVWDRYVKFSENNVTFYATLDDKKYNEEMMKKQFNKIPDNIKVVTTESITKSILLYFNPIKRINRKKEVKELVKKSDAIIIRTPCNIDSIVAKYAKKYNKPYMLEVVGCVWDSLWNYNLKGKILAPINFMKMKRLVKNSKYSIYVTNEFLQKRYPTKGKHTNCSNVILTKINDKDLEERINKIKKSTKKIILGTSAALDVKYKGQENVIKAISVLINNGYNIEYQLIGNGSVDRLKNIAKKFGVLDNVKFIGSIPHKEVFDFFNNIDIYIQPSKQEGLPRALIEAMSKACPSIGTNIAGIPELLNKNCLYNKNDIKRLAQIIEYFINNKQFMIEQAKNNLKKAKEYKIEKINERRFEFYRIFKKENNLL